MCWHPNTILNVLIPATKISSRIADYLRMTISFHLVLMLLFLVAGFYLEGLFDLLGVVTGFVAVSNTNGYYLVHVLAYSLYVAIKFIITFIRFGDLFFLLFFCFSFFE